MKAAGLDPSAGLDLTYMGVTRRDLDIREEQQRLAMDARDERMKEHIARNSWMTTLKQSVNCSMQNCHSKTQRVSDQVDLLLFEEMIGKQQQMRPFLPHIVPTVFHCYHHALEPHHPQVVSEDPLSTLKQLTERAQVAVYHPYCHLLLVDEAIDMLKAGTMMMNHLSPTHPSAKTHSVRLNSIYHIHLSMIQNEENCTTNILEA
jgi:hypothetical protein